MCIIKLELSQCLNKIVKKTGQDKENGMCNVIRELVTLPLKYNR